MKRAVHTFVQSLQNAPNRTVEQVHCQLTTPELPDNAGKLVRSLSLGAFSRARPQEPRQVLIDYKGDAGPWKNSDEVGP